MMNIINVYIDGDSYNFKTKKSESEVLRNGSAGIPTDEFLIWFDNQTEGYYSADTLSEMVVGYESSEYVIEF